MKKKIHKLQIIRHTIQLLLFFLLPGLYTLTFSELGKLYKMIISGNLNFISFFTSSVELTTVIVLTVLFGRFFCGWFCAFGAFNDFLFLASRKLFKFKFKIDEEIDSMLKYIKYLILIIIVIIIWTKGSTLFLNANPWDAFAQISNFSYVLSNLTIGFILLCLISIGCLFVERFFCRYLCPLGALFTIVSKINILKIKKPNDKCGKCRMCTVNCSMGLQLYKSNSVNSGECINCLKCLEVCPRKNTSINIFNKSINPLFIITLVIAVFLSLYAGTSIIRNSSSNKVSNYSTSSIISSKNAGSVKYKDGVYTGTGTGFRGGTTTIKVTVQNGKISKIETTSNNDTPDFYNRAIGTISSEIISEGSTSVDSVSGATYSSHGIMEAVDNALSQAK